MADVRKLADCTYFLLGNCSRGNDCIFRHSETSKSSQTECDGWIRKECFDVMCRHRHTLTNLKFKNASLENPEKPLCKYFLHGKCNFGDKCQFSHGNSIVPVYQEKNNINKRSAAEMLSKYSFKCQISIENKTNPEKHASDRNALSLQSEVNAQSNIEELKSTENIKSSNIMSDPGDSVSSLGVSSLVETEEYLELNEKIDKRFKSS